MAKLVKDFQEADLNGDGVLSLDEWNQMLDNISAQHKIKMGGCAQLTNE